MSKFCLNCGKELDSGIQYCGNCGQSVNAQNNVQVGMVTSDKYNGMAITGFVCSLVSIIFGSLIIPGVLGLVFSIVGMKQITVNKQKGKGLAIAGLVISIVALSIYILIYLFICSVAGCISTAALY